VTLNVLTPDSRQAQYSIDVVDGVDDAAGTMDIAGTTYEVAAAAVIRDSKGAIITLAALAGILVYNDSTGVPTYAKIHQDFDGTTWRITAIDIVSDVKENPYETYVSGTALMRGEVMLDDETDVLTIQGFTVDLPAGYTGEPSSLEILDGDGNLLTWADFEAIYQENLAKGLPTHTVIEFSETTPWLADRILLKTGMSDSLSGKLDGVDVSGDTISLLGADVNMSEAVIKLSDGTTISLEDLFNILSDNPAYAVESVNESEKTMTVNGVTYTVDTDCLIYDADGMGVSWIAFAKIIQEYGTTIHVKVESTGTEATSIRMMKPAADSVYVDVVADKIGGEWVATEVTVKSIDYAEPEFPDYFASTEPYVILSGIKFDLDDGFYVTDERDPLDPVNVTLAELAGMMQDDPSLCVDIFMNQAGDAAGSASILFSGKRVIEGVLRQNIIDAVESWLVSVSGKTQQAINNIVTWLDGQSEHFGVSAFDAVAFFLDPVKNVTDYAYLVAQTIIRDIQSGVIGNAPTGDLQVSLYGLSQIVALESGSTPFAYSIDFDELKALTAAGERVIAHVGGDHYVVVTDIDAFGNVTVLENNRYVITSRQHFLAEWDGAVLSMTQPAMGTALTAAEQKAILGAGADVIEEGGGGEGWIEIEPGKFVPWYGMAASDSAIKSLMDSGTNSGEITMIINSYSGSGKLTSKRYYGPDTSELNNAYGNFLFDVKIEDDPGEGATWRKIRERLQPSKAIRITYLTKDEADALNDFSLTGLVLEYRGTPAGQRDWLDRYWWPMIDYGTDPTDQSTGTIRSNKIIALGLDMNAGGEKIPINQKVTEKTYNTVRDALEMYKSIRDAYEEGRWDAMNEIKASLNSGTGGFLGGLLDWLAGNTNLEEAYSDISSSLQSFWGGSTLTDYISGMGTALKGLPDEAFGTYTNFAGLAKTFVNACMSHWKLRRHFSTPTSTDGNAVSALYGVLEGMKNAYVNGTKYSYNGQVLVDFTEDKGIYDGSYLGIDWSAPWAEDGALATAVKNAFDSQKIKDEKTSIMTAFDEQIAKLGIVNDTVAKALGDDINSQKTNVEDALATINNLLAMPIMNDNTIPAQVAAYLKQAVEDAKTALTTLKGQFDPLKTAITTAMDKVKEHLTNVKNQIETSLNALVGKMDAMKDSILSKIRHIYDLGKDLYDNGKFKEKRSAGEWGYFMTYDDEGNLVERKGKVAHTSGYSKFCEGTWESTGLEETTGKLDAYLNAIGSLPDFSSIVTEMTTQYKTIVNKASTELKAAAGEELTARKAIIQADTKITESIMEGRKRLLDALDEAEEELSIETALIEGINDLASEASTGANPSNFGAGFDSNQWDQRKQAFEKVIDDINVMIDDKLDRDDIVALTGRAQQLMDDYYKRNDIQGNNGGYLYKNIDPMSGKIYGLGRDTLGIVYTYRAVLEGNTWASGGDVKYGSLISRVWNVADQYVSTIKSAGPFPSLAQNSHVYWVSGLLDGHGQPRDPEAEQKEEDNQIKKLMAGSTSPSKPSASSSPGSLYSTGTLGVWQYLGDGGNLNKYFEWSDYRGLLPEESSSYTVAYSTARKYHYYASLVKSWEFVGKYDKSDSTTNRYDAYFGTGFADAPDWWDQNIHSKVLDRDPYFFGSKQLTIYNPVDDSGDNSATKIHTSDKIMKAVFKRDTDISKVMGDYDETKFKKLYGFYTDMVPEFLGKAASALAEDAIKIYLEEVGWIEKTRDEELEKAAMMRDKSLAELYTAECNVKRQYLVSLLDSGKKAWESIEEMMKASNPGYTAPASVRAWLNRKESYFNTTSLAVLNSYIGSIQATLINTAFEFSGGTADAAAFTAAIARAKKRLNDSYTQSSDDMSESMAKIIKNRQKVWENYYKQVEQINNEMDFQRNMQEQHLNNIIGSINTELGGVLKDLGSMGSEIKLTRGGNANGGALKFEIKITFDGNNVYTYSKTQDNQFLTVRDIIPNQTLTNDMDADGLVASILKPIADEDEADYKRRARIIAPDTAAKAGTSIGGAANLSEKDVIGTQEYFLRMQKVTSDFGGRVLGWLDDAPQGSGEYSYMQHKESLIGDGAGNDGTFQQRMKTLGKNWKEAQDNASKRMGLWSDEDEKLITKTYDVKTLQEAASMASSLVAELSERGREMIAKNQGVAAIQPAGDFRKVLRVTADKIRRADGTEQTQLTGMFMSGNDLSPVLMVTQRWDGTIERVTKREIAIDKKTGKVTVTDSTYDSAQGVYAGKTERHGHLVKNLKTGKMEIKYDYFIKDGKRVTSYEETADGSKKYMLGKIVDGEIVEEENGVRIDRDGVTWVISKDGERALGEQGKGRVISYEKIYENILRYDPETGKWKQDILMVGNITREFEGGALKRETPAFLNNSGYWISMTKQGRFSSRDIAIFKSMVQSSNLSSSIGLTAIKQELARFLGRFENVTVQGIIVPGMNVTGSITAGKDEAGHVVFTAVVDITKQAGKMMGGISIRQAKPGEKADFTQGGVGFVIEGDKAGAEALKKWLDSVGTRLDMNISAVVMGGIALNVKGNVIKLDLNFGVTKDKAGDYQVGASADMTSAIRALGIKDVTTREAKSGEKADYTDPVSGKGYVFEGGDSAAVKSMVESLAATLGVDFSATLRDGITVEVGGRSIRTDLIVSASMGADGAYTSQASADITKIADAMGMGKFRVRRANPGEKADFTDARGNGYILAAGKGGDALKTLVQALAEKLGMDFRGSIQNGLTVNINGRTMATDLVIGASRETDKSSANYNKYVAHASANISSIAKALGVKNFKVREAKAGERADFRDANGNGYIIAEGQGGNALKSFVEAMSAKFDMPFTGIVTNGLTVSIGGLDVITDLMVGASKDTNAGSATFGKYTAHASADITAIARVLGMDNFSIRKAARNEAADIKDSAGNGYILSGGDSDAVKALVKSLAQSLGMNFSGTIIGGIRTEIGGKSVTADLVLGAALDMDKDSTTFGQYRSYASADITAIAKALGVKNIDVRKAGAGAKADFTASDGTGYMIMGSGDAATLKAIVNGLAMGLDAGISAVIRDGLSVTLNGHPTISTDLVINSSKDVKTGSYAAQISINATAIARALGFTEAGVRKAGAGEIADFTDGSGTGYVLDGKNSADIRNFILALGTKLDSNIAATIIGGLKVDINGSIVITDLVLGANKDTEKGSKTNGSYVGYAYANITRIAAAFGMTGYGLREAKAGEKADITTTDGRGFVLTGSGAETIKALMAVLSKGFDLSFSGVINDGLSVTDNAGSKVATDLIIGALKDARGETRVQASANVTRLARALGVTSYHARAVLPGEKADFTIGGSGYKYDSGAGIDVLRSLINSLGGALKMNLAATLNNGLTMSVTGRDGTVRDISVDLNLNAVKNEKQGGYSTNIYGDITQLAGAFGFRGMEARRALAGEKFDFTDVNGNGYVLKGDGCDMIKRLAQAIGEEFNASFIGNVSDALRIVVAVR
ncbi:MAG: hypothetical protein PHY34_06305, partial [Patescibacteria group bacterium]|nr:hypothetical protein [Patescibacteria group bacterium]